MAAEIRDAFNVSPRLIKGGRGIFDVQVDGALVFSKFETGRFPNAGEVEALLAKRTAPDT